ncbi:MAG: TraB/GumN family protein [Deferrisomatales bacterium]|nr:TraB/GumN family protein [Deferrisomatales bacterium]
MSTPPAPEADAPTRIDLPDRTVYLVGTAHVSQHSVEDVRRAIEELRPDCVCVELDAQRLEALRDPNRWKDLNLGAALRRGNGAFLLANLALSSFQRRMGLHTGVRPGAELLEAVEEAERRGAAVELVDRPIRTTLLRAWRRTGLWKKVSLFSALLASAFENPELGEEDLARLRQKDALSGLLEEMGQALPAAKEILIDERDRYMAERIRRAPGRTVVAVVGAGHLPGISRELAGTGDGADLEALDAVPPKPLSSRVIPWLIPTVVVALFAFGFFFGDASRVREAAWAWVLANGGFAALGAFLALAHPAAIAAAFFAAPVTSLNPTVGAGMVTGLVQAWAGKPRVRDVENLLDDLGHWKGWWANRVSRVLLVFLFSNLGSSVGTFVAFGWLKDLV